MIRGELMLRDHDEAAKFFGKLIHDLALDLIEMEHDPITVERLNEARRHLRDIKECQRPARVF